MEMNYKDMKIEDIIFWCVENNQKEWLKAEAAKKMPFKVYPRVKVKNEDGTYSWKVDKTKEPTIEERPISFIQLKLNFVNKFLPELAPKAKEKVSMYDKIKNL